MATYGTAASTSAWAAGSELARTAGAELPVVTVGRLVPCGRLTASAVFWCGVSRRSAETRHECG
jgi:hypothetical protein